MARLLFICPGVLGGVRSYVLNLTAFLRDRNVDYGILFYTPTAGIRTHQSTNPQERSVTLHYSAYASQPAVYRSLGNCFGRDDILICSDSLELDAINYLQVPNKIVFLMHGDLEHYNSILHRHASIIDKAGCVSIGLKDKYSQLYPSVSFSVAHPLVADFKGEKPESADGEMRGVFIGRVEYLKGADTFINLIKLAEDEQLSIRWVVFATSKGSDPGLLAELPKEVDLNLDGPNSAVLSALEKADWLIFPSRSEGFGIAVLEAQKRGVVPIARPLPIGIPDMIRPRETGFLAETAEEMLAIIRQWSSDRRALAELRRSVMRFANDHFDYEKTGLRFLAIIEEVDNLPVDRKKKFGQAVINRMERILPEWIYRPSKFIYSRIKYRNSI